MEKRFQFENKVYYKKYRRKKISSKRYVITILFIVFLLIAALLNKAFLTPGLFLIMVLLLSLITIPKSELKNEGYFHVHAELEVSSCGIRLINKNFDKFDGFGLRDEETFMSAENIENIYFSKELLSLCITGKGNMDMRFLKKKKNHTVKVRNMYVYAEQEKIQDMIHTMETALNMEIKTVK